MFALKQKAKIKLTDEFNDTYDLLENTQQNVFITGKAGTGKTTFLDYFRANTTKNVAVVAPTGVVAINIGGQTIHSFFKFKPGFIEPGYSYRARHDLRKFYKALDVLIIDEISMVRADMFDAIDSFLRVNGKNPGEPFGGCQLCIVGDLFQLPPVLTDSESEIFYRYYKTPYFFGAKCFDINDFKLVELTQVFRQSEIAFINLLNEIRNNSLSEGSLYKLNEICCKPDGAEDAVVLTSTNRVADNINQSKLAQIKNPVFTYTSKSTGDFANGMRQLPAYSELSLKVGAQVMFVRNDKDKKWVNGTVGKITKLSDKEIFVDIDGSIFEVPLETWELIKYEFDESEEKITEVVTGTFKQFPLQLAWAITIHKSQGKTFDNVTIDFGYGAFAPGQAYVALSRCRTFGGLRLKRPLRNSDIINDKNIIDFFEDYGSL